MTSSTITVLPKNSDVSPLSKKSGFFAVDPSSWSGVCNCTMNMAIAYLVLCRGTGANNQTTAWSVNAIETHTGISRSRANTAIEKLIECDFIEQTKSGKRPRYKIDRDSIAKTENQIWLPNELVTGTDKGESPPIERIRQTGDVMLLRLFVDLYQHQNLIEEGGISRNTYHTEYIRELTGEFRQFNLWFFGQGKSYVHWNRVTLPHRREELTPDEEAAGSNPGIDFFKRMNNLAMFGLIQCVPHLFESDTDEAEIIHSLGTTESVELELTQAAHDAYCAAQQYRFSDVTEDLRVLPLPKHLENVQVIGIWRLRYRPQTSMTSKWWGELNNTGVRWLDQYKNIAESLSQEPHKQRVSA